MSDLSGTSPANNGTLMGGAAIDTTNKAPVPSGNPASLAVSASGASTNAVSSGRATSDISMTGENSGDSDSLLTSTTALAPPRRATTYLVRR